VSTVPWWHGLVEQEMREVSGRARPGHGPTWAAVVGAGVLMLVPGGAGAVMAAEQPPPVAPSPTVEPFEGRPDGDHLAVIGDSITDLTREELHRELNPSWAVSVDGRHGYTVAEQVPTANVYGAQTPPPAVAVVNLGTNDSTQGIPVQQVDSAMGQVLAPLASARCVVLVTVNANTMDPARNERANEINFWVLWARAASDGRIRLADWNTVVHDHYDRNDRDLTTDMVHPNQKGQDLLADVVTDAVAGCP
jgi:hypothetical protein